LNFMSKNNFHNHSLMSHRTKPHQNRNKSTVHYTFHFTSLITPHKINNVRLLNTNMNSNISKKHKKLFTKQSYLLMTWLWYIQKNSISKAKPSFAYKPTKVHKTTLIKSPMAHKTFSQEQFQFQFFNLVISFSNKINSFHLPKVNQLLFLILSLKSSVPFVETNFFLLKKFQIKLPASTKDFLLI
jgi:hypothetical protein